MAEILWLLLPLISFMSLFCVLHWICTVVSVLYVTVCFISLCCARGVLHSLAFIFNSFLECSEPPAVICFRERMEQESDTLRYWN